MSYSRNNLVLRYINRPTVVVIAIATTIIIIICQISTKVTLELISLNNFKLTKGRKRSKSYQR